MYVAACFRVRYVQAEPCFWWYLFVALCFSVCCLVNWNLRYKMLWQKCISLVITVTIVSSILENNTNSLSSLDVDTWHLCRKHSIISTSEAEELVVMLIYLFLDRQLLGLSVILHECMLSAISFFTDNEWNTSSEEVAKSIACRLALKFQINVYYRLCHHFPSFHFSSKNLKLIRFLLILV